MDSSEYEGVYDEEIEMNEEEEFEAATTLVELFNNSFTAEAMGIDGISQEAEMLQQQLQYEADNFIPEFTASMLIASQNEEDEEQQENENDNDETDDEVQGAQEEEWHRPNIPCTCFSSEKKCTDCLNDDSVKYLQNFGKIRTSNIHDRHLSNATTVLLTSSRGKNAKKENLEVKDLFKGSSRYSLGSVKMCEKAFHFLWKTSAHTFSSMRSDGRKGLLGPNRKKRKKTGGRTGQAESVSRFMNELIHNKGLPNPSGRSVNKEVLLPKTLTKKEVYSRYCESFIKSQEIAVDTNTDILPPALDVTSASSTTTMTTTQQNIVIVQPLSYNAFTYHWRRYFPHVKQGTSKTDVCDDCSKLFRRAFPYKGTNGLTKLEKLQRVMAMDTLRQHLGDVEAERKVFKEYLKKTRDSNGKSVHVSFDFSQNVRLPMLQIEPKQLFFTTGKIIDIFGIANTTDLKQHNFLLEEGKWKRDKGPNGVLSMLHFYLCKNILTSFRSSTLKSIYFMADNCMGLNKNHHILRYFSMLSAIFNLNINYQFLVRGHTKFFPDGCFGLMKRKLRRQDVLSAKQVAQYTLESGDPNEIVIQWSSCASIGNASLTATSLMLTGITSN
eukprot:m.166967 g.166967  ORF g.166967 m.166967 type:complete len:609 (+) comp13459_c0_seq1:194-2020(+)